MWLSITWSENYVDDSHVEWQSCGCQSRGVKIMWMTVMWSDSHADVNHVE